MQCTVLCSVLSPVPCAVQCTVQCALPCAVHCAVPCVVQCTVPPALCPVLCSAKWPCSVSSTCRLIRGSIRGHRRRNSSTFHRSLHNPCLTLVLPLSSFPVSRLLISSTPLHLCSAVNSEAGIVPHSQQVSLFLFASLPPPLLPSPFPPPSSVSQPVEPPDQSHLTNRPSLSTHQPQGGEKALAMQPI